MVNYPLHKMAFSQSPTGSMPLQSDSSGNLRVNIASGTFAVQAQLTNTSGTVQPVSNLSGTLNTVPLAQFSSGTITLTSGQLAPFQTDINGNLAVREQLAPVYEDNTNGVAVTVDALLSNATYSPSLATGSGGSGVTITVKASAGNVLSAHFSSVAANPRWFQLHDLAGASSLSTGRIPVYSFRCPTSQSLVRGNDFFVGAGAHFSNGIKAGWSTTSGSFTAAPDGWELEAFVHYK